MLWSYIKHFDELTVVINLVSTFLSVLSDKYKPDPSDAAGPRSEQLSYSDGWPAH